MRDIKIYLHKDMSPKEVLECTYAILNSRLIVGSYINKMGNMFNKYRKLGNKRMMKACLELILIVCNDKEVAKSLKVFFKAGQYAEISKRLNTSILLGYTLGDAGAQLEILAKYGHLKSISTYLKCKTKNWDEEVLEMARQIDEKKEKTPEEWEVSASLHYADEIAVWGNGLENIKTIDDLILAYVNSYKKTKEFRPMAQMSQALGLAHYNCEVYKCNYLFNCLGNKNYVINMRKAQEGYYRRYVEQNYFDDLNNFLETIEGNSRVLIQSEKLAKYSDGQFLGYKHLYGCLNKTIEEQIKNNDCDLLSFYYYNRSMCFTHSKPKMIARYMANLDVVASTGLQINCRQFSTEKEPATEKSIAK